MGRGEGGREGWGEGREVGRGGERGREVYTSRPAVPS